MSDIEIYRQLDQRADINCDMDATGIGILATVLSGPILLLVWGDGSGQKSRKPNSGLQPKTRGMSA